MAKTVSRLVTIAVNLLALALGVAYLVHPMPYMLWNMYGFVILLALIGSLVLACLGGKNRYLDYCYLMLFMVGMFLILILNTFAASSVQNKTSQSVFALILYNVIFLSGAALSGWRVMCDFKERSSCSENETTPPQGKSRKILRWTAVILLCAFLLFMLLLSYILLGKSTGTHGFIEVFIPEYGVFWGLLTFAATVFVVRLRWRKKGSAVNKIIMVVGIVISAIYFVPLACVPLTMRNADAAYREAFGDVYLDDRISGEELGFMRGPFSLQDYFFGARTTEYRVEENVLFYEGTTGKDAGIRLHFDVYMPIADGDSDISGGNSSGSDIGDSHGGGGSKSGGLADKNPTLIRIHGGAWTLGDKGFSNYSATNKHFANLGYVVFDIQYGLSDKNPSLASSVVPASIKGDFDIDDMVRHIGIFTTYLADHADEYGADMDSVFITGASAGGQLAVAAALGITGGKYTDILDSRLQIRGLIPFYPANSLSAGLGIGGAPDLVDPSALVDENSPPCLIYHGTHDGIVDPKYASILRQTYADRGNEPCAVLWMEFASHGSDFYTPGYFNRIFMYYMERFMHLYSLDR